jgi:hypothetical protein
VLLTLDLEDRWPILDDPQPMVAESIGKAIESVNDNHERTKDRKHGQARTKKPSSVRFKWADKKPIGKKALTNSRFEGSS